MYQGLQKEQNEPYALHQTFIQDTKLLSLKRLGLFNFVDLCHSVFTLFLKSKYSIIFKLFFLDIFSNLFKHIYMYNLLLMLFALYLLFPSLLFIVLRIKIISQSLFQKTTLCAMKPQIFGVSLQIYHHRYDFNRKCHPTCIILSVIQQKITLWVLCKNFKQKFSFHLWLHLFFLFQF